jgi:hypothetical protein
MDVKFEHEVALPEKYTLPNPKIRVYPHLLLCPNALLLLKLL